MHVLRRRPLVAIAAAAGLVVALPASSQAAAPLRPALSNGDFADGLASWTAACVGFGGSGSSTCDIPTDAAGAHIHRADVYNTLQQVVTGSAAAVAEASLVIDHLEDCSDSGVFVSMTLLDDSGTTLGRITHARHPRPSCEDYHYESGQAAVEVPEPQWVEGARVAVGIDAAAEVAAGHLPGLDPTQVTQVGFTVTTYSGDRDPVAVTLEHASLSTERAPSAVADSATLGEDDNLSTAAPGVLANDSDPEGDPVQVSLVAPASHGEVALAPDGSYEYQPDADFAGVDSFTYRATDGTATSRPATVTITVLAVPDAPGGEPDAYTTAEDEVLSVPAPGVLGNDVNHDDSSLAAEIASGPQHGTVDLAPDGSFTYRPSSDYAGPDSFTYRSSSGSAASPEIAVGLTVTPVDDAPTPADDAYSALEDTQLVIGPEDGLLANDADVDGDPLAVTLSAGPAHGTLVVNTDGSFSYVPDADYTGPEQFDYTVSDGSRSARATARISVAAAPLIPTQLQATPALALSSASPPVLSATLTAGGEPLAGRSVTFSAGGATVCSAVTDVRGRASCGSAADVVGVLVRNGYDVRFAGDADYLPAEAHGAAAGI